MWNISDPGWAKGAWSSLYAPLKAGATAFIDQVRCICIFMVKNPVALPVCRSSLVMATSMFHITIGTEVDQECSMACTT